jgi:hypothetical protein
VTTSQRCWTQWYLLLILSFADRFSSHSLNSPIPSLPFAFFHIIGVLGFALYSIRLLSWIHHLHSPDLRLTPSARFHDNCDNPNPIYSFSTAAVVSDSSQRHWIPQLVAQALYHPGSSASLVLCDVSLLLFLFYFILLFIIFPFYFLFLSFVISFMGVSSPIFRSVFLMPV